MTIALPEVTESVLKKANVLGILRDRKSNRVYSAESLTLDELAFLLWATQGVKGIRENNYCTLRPVPSAGARHPFEPFLTVNMVEELTPGVYRCLALTHELLLLKKDDKLEEKLYELTLGQKFFGENFFRTILS